jgi:hypothetical protein
MNSVPEIPARFLDEALETWLTCGPADAPHGCRHDMTERPWREYPCALHAAVARALQAAHDEGVEDCVEVLRRNGISAYIPHLRALKSSREAE